MMPPIDPLSKRASVLAVAWGSSPGRQRRDVARIYRAPVSRRAGVEM